MTKQEMVANINELVHEGLGFRNLDFSHFVHLPKPNLEIRLAHAERAVEIQHEIEALKRPWLTRNSQGFLWWEIYSTFPASAPQEWQAASSKAMELYREFSAHWAKV